MIRKVEVTVASFLLLLVVVGCQKVPIGRHLGPSIFLSVYSNDTRGLMMTTDSINFTGQSFKMNGYLDASIASAGGASIDDKSNFHFISDAVVDYTGDNSSHKWDWHGASGDADRPMWRSGLPIRFWSCHPIDPFGLSIIWPHTVGGATPSNEQQTKVEFSYELPAPVGDDAENQTDLLFAYNDETRFFKKVAPYDETAPLIVDPDNPGNKGTRNDEKIDIKFYHVLSAVNFDITTMDSSVDLASITINHVRHSGSCTIDGPLLAAPEAGESGAGTGGVDWSGLSSDFRNFSQSFTRADFETLETSGATPETYVRQKVSGRKTFFMIPQTLDGASLSVAFNYKAGGVPITLTKDLDADIWKPGKIYTYRITLTANNGVYTLLDVTLDVKDWVNGGQDVSF